MLDQALTFAQAQAALGVAKSTLEAWLASGYIKALPRVGGFRGKRILVSELVDALANRPRSRKLDGPKSRRVRRRTTRVRRARKRMYCKWYRVCDSDRAEAIRTADRARYTGPRHDKERFNRRLRAKRRRLRQDRLKRMERYHAKKGQKST